MTMTANAHYVRFASSLLVALAVTGCHQKGDDSASTPSHPATVASTASSAKPAASTPQPLRSKPDFGGVTTQHVEVTATGPSLESAVDNAIRLAIEQVNGKKVDAGSLQMNAGMNVAADGHGVDLTSNAYANWVASATSGAVSHFQLLSQKQINTPKSTDEESLKASQGASWNKGNVDASANASASASDGAGDAASANASEGVKGSWDQHQGATQVDYEGKHTEYTSQWEVRIGADVATYREAADAKLTRVVVAQPQASSATYQIGDSTIASNAIASDIQSKVAEALTQTHRFTVLDRTADAQISQEIGLIQSGNATVADTARLGQQLAADLIVIPTINRFEYVRHEHPLRLADRTLVSYAGGGEVSFRVVNAATGQMVMSQSFKYDFPPTSPTTLGVSVDGNTLASTMMDAVDRNIVASILQSTYPLSVIQVQGQNVVINQGGEAVQVGATYQAVSLGNAVVDPQSGQSLGPTETPCCSITVDRVTPNLSYGHIVESSVHLDSPYKPGSLELRGQLAINTTASSSGPTKAVQAAHSKRSQASQANAATNDPNW